MLFRSLSDLCTSSLRLMKPTRQMCSKAYRDQNPGIRPPTEAARAITHGQWLLEPSHAPRRFSPPSSDLSYTRRQDGLVVPRYTWLEKLVIIRRDTRQNALPGYLSCHHAPIHTFTRLPCAKEHMLMSSGDVIIPHQGHVIG